MYLTIKQQVKNLSKEEYLILKELCHIAKNLTNEAIYSIRQYFFANQKFLRYEENYKVLKNSENYKLLNSNIAQQILMEVDGSFKAFFGALKAAQKEKAPSGKVRLPGYLPKDGYTTLVIAMFKIERNRLLLPFSNTYRKDHKRVEIKVPPILRDKQVKEIRIIPKANAGFFEIQYTYEAECIQRELEKNNVLAIDPGVDNLMTIAVTNGETLILDGRKLKSINRWYNKENARLQSIKDKQHFGKELTQRQKALLRKRNNRVNDYLSKAAKTVIRYCIEKNIGTIVAGYNPEFQRDVHLGKANNQNFVNIPFGQLMSKLEYLCERNGIIYVRQEESYTSQASFWDRDDIPVYEKDKKAEYTFSGKRIHRGMYQRNNGSQLNADVNGALNILRKSKVVSLEGLYCRGAVNTPIRIRIA